MLTKHGLPYDTRSRLPVPTWQLWLPPAGTASWPAGPATPSRCQAAQVGEEHGCRPLRRPGGRHQPRRWQRGLACCSACGGRCLRIARQAGLRAAASPSPPTPTQPNTHTPTSPTNTPGPEAVEAARQAPVPAAAAPAHGAPREKTPPAHEHLHRGQATHGTPSAINGGTPPASGCWQERWLSYQLSQAGAGTLWQENRSDDCDPQPSAKPPAGG